MRCLIDRSEPSGAHSVYWDGRDGGGRLESAGVYLSALKTNGSVLTCRMIVMR